MLENGVRAVRSWKSVSVIELEGKIFSTVRGRLAAGLGCSRLVAGLLLPRRCLSSGRSSALSGTAHSLLDAASYGSTWVALSPLPTALMIRRNWSHVLSTKIE